MMLFNLLRKNQYFFGPYLLVLLVVGGLQLIYSQEQLMQWVNARNNSYADVFFTYATYMGDGAFFVLICTILLVRYWRIGVMAFASFALSSLTSIALKQLAFPTALRPLKRLEHSTYEYHLIEGLDIHSYNSFPSGHSISAFAVFSLLAMLDERKGRSWLWLLLAVLTAYSRVYLFQHFVEDTFAGALVGVASSVGVYLALQRWALQKKTLSGP
ncbi:phosphatase PAP2 family protein [Fibrisoma montanum]|uniref:Phosphatase PAP2 family protein n=1 Tax=Fibrisoma montanum TaxID=2305895 RepID=A0A418M7Z0_9BACT|nr:phosphatase PAP2 family protein [Fibrisoma montanum]RIV22213.1 phosphatase PAP2 family protein [Fibrisoma montanum]